jgi:quercetin dioxygenase-like cupin family protein
MRTPRIVAIAVLVAASGLARHVARAQQPGLTRIELLRHDLSASGREVIQARFELAPGVSFPKYAHPGEEILYVLDGSIEYQTEGSAPVTLKSGESLFIPAGAFHTAKNVGSGTAAELATYVVEKGKPLSVVK